MVSQGGRTPLTEGGKNAFGGDGSDPPAVYHSGNGLSGVSRESQRIPKHATSELPSRHSCGNVSNMVATSVSEVNMADPSSLAGVRNGCNPIGKNLNSKTPAAEVADLQGMCLNADSTSEPLKSILAVDPLHVKFGPKLSSFIGPQIVQSPNLVGHDEKRTDRQFPPVSITSTSQFVFGSFPVSSHSSTKGSRAVKTWKKRARAV